MPMSGSVVRFRHAHDRGKGTAGLATAALVAVLVYGMPVGKMLAARLKADFLGPELIDEVVASPANTPDRDAVDDLLADHDDDDDKPIVIGDSAYADGATRERLGENGYDVLAKTPPVRNSTGGFPKDRFVIDPNEDGERDASHRAIGRFRALLAQSEQSVSV